MSEELVAMLREERRQWEIDQAWTLHLGEDAATRYTARGDWLRSLMEEQDNLCAYCGDEMAAPGTVYANDPTRATLDHIIPRADDGPDTRENCCAACRFCNNAKGNAPVELFRSWIAYAVAKGMTPEERQHHLSLEARAYTARRLIRDRAMADKAETP